MIQSPCGQICVAAPASSFFDFVYQRGLETLILSFFSIEMLASALVRSFWQPSSLLTLWARPRILINGEYMHFCVQRTQQCSITFAGNFQYGQSGYILAHISMTTWARDFKFAAKIVVGNGGLNSKSVVSALCLVLSWRVTYMLQMRLYYTYDIDQRCRSNFKSDKVQALPTHCALTHPRTATLSRQQYA